MSLRGSTHRQGNLRGLVAFAALWCALLVAVPAGAAAAGSISGTVTKEGTTTPLAGVTVLILKEESDGKFAFAATGQTDATGKYTSNPPLPAGEYFVEFNGERIAYFRKWYPEKTDFADAVPVVLGTDEKKTGIDGALVRGASFSGVVTEAATGEPAPFVRVCAYDGTGIQQTCGETGVGGSYLVGPLLAGDYRLAFLPFNESLVAEYFSDKPTLEEATPLHVEDGEASTGKNAALSAPPPPVVPPSTPPVFSQPPPPLVFTEPPPTVRPHRLHCKKGFRKRKVKGKVRCVKIHRKRHHRVNR